MTPCVLWAGRIDSDGYGRIGRDFAHRRAYESQRGPIPAGMTVDHECFTPACVNVTHMRLVTADENRRRQRSAFATHCINGHEFTPENTYRRSANSTGARSCRACNREAVARYKSRRIA